MPLTHKQIIPFIVSLALFMEAVDTTIINTAIPVMAESLKVNPVDLKIALISYLLSLAIFIPISGWIADKFGVKKVFISALALFTLSSVWCGFAHHLRELVVARFLQGLGGSLTLPIGRLILARTFARHELIKAMSRTVMVASIGMMIGPVLGGFITHYFSWHWIFWVNIPVGLLTMVMAHHWLEKTPAQVVPRLDKLGFLLFGIGLAGLTFGFSALSETSVRESSALMIILASTLFLFAYVWHSRKERHPIVKKELFQPRTFQVSALGNILSRIGFGGVPFLLPLFLQIGLGYSPQLSGMLLAPMALGVLIVKALSLMLLRLMGYKRLLMINTLLVGISIWTFILISSHTSIYTIAGLTFLFGFLVSLQYTGMNSLAYADMAQENLSAATSVIGTIQQLAQSFGVAVSALLLRYLAPSFNGDTILTTTIFHHTFFAMGLLTFLSILIFKRLQPKDGYQLITKAAEGKVVT